MNFSDIVPCSRSELDLHVIANRSILDHLELNVELTLDPKLMWINGRDTSSRDIVDLHSLQAQSNPTCWYSGLDNVVIRLDPSNLRSHAARKNRQFIPLRNCTP